MREQRREDRRIHSKPLHKKQTCIALLCRKSKIEAIEKFTNGKIRAPLLAKLTNIQLDKAIYGMTEVVALPISH